MMYFMADAHLSENNQAAIKAFIVWLQAWEGEGSLYILGDLFDQWVGDDHPPDWCKPIYQACVEAKKRGLKIYVMRGNRDFLLGRVFAEETGCILLEEPHVVDRDGQRFLMMHGDTLCSKDLAYQRWRKVVRHPWVQSLFLSLPIGLRMRLGRSARSQSQQANAKKEEVLMDVVQETLDDVMQRYQADFLIHGHTHRPHFDEKRLVLPDWHQGAWMLCYDQGSWSLEALYMDHATS